MAEASSPDEGEMMETVTSADGTEIAFERTGSGPPLVFVHGTGVDYTWWDLSGVSPALADHCTVYAINRRGRGESGDAEEYKLEREVKDVLAVVEPIDDPVTLLGHSYGANISLEAARQTNHLSDLILNDPVIPVGDDYPDGDALVGELTSLLADGQPEQALVFIWQAAGVPQPLIDEARSTPNWRELVDAADTILRELQAITENDFDAPRFAGMTTPTLLLSGSESSEIHNDTKEAVSNAVPNCRTVTFDGHGHFAMVTTQDRFIDEVLAVVRESN
ncbi:alpha/beta hydrolase [Natronococcus sp. A-GB7]|uniref:alpha/beta fold hydrolase n=1 Tax=Natronococcus sp. A-GB7 TaxID=3037649 RepID=UPI00241CCE5F|nr:alpha/beta hydrolase [Natronococcus sp. A-GB7]MDG5818978.1 alpha/beta hydrolase [Natronococcus sp. A-GB7]